MKAIWNGVTLAESSNTIIIENNHYFPPDSVNMQYLEMSDHHTVCPWKGNASYYSIIVDDKRNENAAWTYAHPKAAAQEISAYIAFWNGVSVTE